MAKSSPSHRQHQPGTRNGRDRRGNNEQLQSGDSSELAPGLPCKGKSVRNRGVSQIMPFLVIPRSLLRGGFIFMAPFSRKRLYGGECFQCEVGESIMGYYSFATD